MVVSRVVIVGVGSNLGAREASIAAARDLLAAREGIAVRSVSALYETEPLGPPQPSYLNAAYRLQTDLPAPALLQVLLRTERRLGRRRTPSERWGPRSIDLDLLWDERGPYESSELRVPHPELENRDFALRPLLDVAPELGESLGPALKRLGSQLTPWTRAAVVRTSASEDPLEVNVEADSEADACALSVQQPRPPGRPWSTRHVIVEAGPEPFAAAVRAVCRAGFSIHRTTIAHCSKSQWATAFHGVDLGIPTEADVRLWTTSGANRSLEARFSISFGRQSVVF